MTTGKPFTSIFNMATKLSKKKVLDVCHCIDRSFSWEETKEGWRYWHTVYDAMNEIERKLSHVE